MKWTADQVPDLSGKTIVITGGNSGIGFEAARVCVARGADTILACRSVDRATAAVESIRSETPGGEVESLSLDLGSLASVREFARSLAERVAHLDILVNNAGIMMPPYQTTEDGFESQMGVNHLGHFALTGLLMPSLKAAPAARVVNIASLAHRGGKMDWDNLVFDGGKGYSRMGAYGRSKLSNLLFTFGLQQRFEAGGCGAIAVVAHPGVSATNLMRDFEQHWYARPVAALARKVLQPAWMGALPTLRAVADPDVEGGDYYGPSQWAEWSGSPVKVGCEPKARDSESIERLWTISEQLTNVTFQ